MFSERTFQIAFFISLILHSTIFIQNIKFSILPKNKIQESQINYVIMDRKNQILETKKAEDGFLKLSPKILTKISPSPFKDNIIQKNKELIDFNKTLNKPEVIKSELVALQKKVTLPPLDIDKLDQPYYISYYQTVREKIRRAAYQNYLRNDTGEVYLSFILSHNGELKEVRLVEGKTKASDYLKEVALRSIKEAAPFPSFPKELDYPQLSFNVIISFQIE
ncbi:MAG: hypothetical protein NC912_02095 [Candidatus Omnitrophica bacterium]|nr:hypothetical protein [Candidatus Omnitrophota bacterium]